MEQRIENINVKYKDLLTLKIYKLIHNIESYYDIFKIENALKDIMLYEDIIFLIYYINIKKGLIKYNKRYKFIFIRYLGKLLYNFNDKMAADMVIILDHFIKYDELMDLWDFIKILFSAFEWSPTVNYATKDVIKLLHLFYDTFILTSNFNVVKPDMVILNKKDLEISILYKISLYDIFKNYRKKTDKIFKGQNIIKFDHESYKYLSSILTPFIHKYRYWTITRKIWIILSIRLNFI